MAKQRIKTEDKRPVFADGPLSGISAPVTDKAKIIAWTGSIFVRGKFKWGVYEQVNGVFRYDDDATGEVVRTNPLKTGRNIVNYRVVSDIPVFRIEGP